MNAALEEASRQGLSPLEALKRVTHEYLACARRFPARYKIMIEEANAGREDSELRSEVRRMFQTVVHLVEAAQQAGYLKKGDPPQMGALIVGGLNGLPYGLGRAEIAGSDAEHFLLRLVDRLAGKAGGGRQGQRTGAVAEASARRWRWRRGSRE